MIELSEKWVSLRHPSAKILLAAWVVCLSGCTGSVHPLLTEDELVEEMDLSGKWEMELVGPKKEKQLVPVELEKYDTSTYDMYLRVEQVAKKKQDTQDFPDVWTLQIGKIDGKTFAQMIPSDPQLGPMLSKGIPVYIFGRLEVETDTMKFYPPADAKCAALVGREKLQHMTYELSDIVEVTILTMSTEKLQKVIAKHGKEMFNPKPIYLRRISTDDG